MFSLRYFHYALYALHHEIVLLDATEICKAFMHIRNQKPEYPVERGQSYHMECISLHVDIDMMHQNICVISARYQNKIPRL